jgi:hypothetical protein
MKLEFSRQSFKKSSDTKFPHPFSGSRVVPCGQTDMTKLNVAFHNFANAPNENSGHITITKTLCEIWNRFHRLGSCVESICGTGWLGLTSGLNKAIDFLTKSVHNRCTSSSHCRTDHRSLFSAAISWLRAAEAITEVISYSDRDPGTVGQSGEVKDRCM